MLDCLILHEKHYNISDFSDVHLGNMHKQMCPHIRTYFGIQTGELNQGSLLGVRSGIPHNLEWNFPGK